MRFTHYINPGPASNFHHAIRMAEKLEFPLNLFVTLNFRHTACLPDDTGAAFQRLRQKFAKWSTRPPARHAASAVPATFVWVLERPQDDLMNCHWLVHVPKKRQKDFQAKLPKWLASVAGELGADAIHIKAAYLPRGAGKYMLKGMKPETAEYFGIRPAYQGIVFGKRSGFSRNLGPTQKRRLRAIGIYPPARKWVKFSI